MSVNPKSPRLAAIVIAQLAFFLAPALALGEDAHRHPWVFLWVTLGVVSCTIGAYDAGFLRGAVAGALYNDARRRQQSEGDVLPFRPRNGHKPD